MPYSATGGGITRPRRPFEGSPREPPDGRLAGPHGPGVAFRHPRIGDFCSRFALIAPHDPPLREAAVASALRRPTGPHHRWCFAACGRTGPPGTGHSTVAYLPGADRCHVRCRIQTSRQGSGRSMITRLRNAGISGPANTPAATSSEGHFAHRLSSSGLSRGSIAPRAPEQVDGWMVGHSEPVRVQASPTMTGRGATSPIRTIRPILR